MVEFAKGQIIRHRQTGVLYRVLRTDVKQERPDTFPTDLFEIVRVDPPKPTLVAQSFAQHFERVEIVPKCGVCGAITDLLPCPSCSVNETTVLEQETGHV